MRLFRFYCNSQLPASVCILVLCLININIQFCKAFNLRQTNQVSTPEQCARTCRDGEPRKYCYYRFVLEYYTSNGLACNFCETPTNYSRISPICECVILDGFEKTVFSINRMIPGPSIQVCKGDQIMVDVQNHAEGIEASIHWHGIFQNGYQYYDGVPYVTQCPILSANTFRYQYMADNSGTHFYHSHISVHMIDGQYGSLIVRDPPSENPHYYRYDWDLPEHVIVLSDLFHELSMERYPGRFRQNRGQIPDNILINGRGNWVNSTGSSTNVAYSTFNVRSGYRYRFRIINAFSTVCLCQVAIERHGMQIIATDGENVKPFWANALTMASGERIDVVIYANQPVGSYWIHVSGLGECQVRGIYQLAIINYQGSSPSSLSPNPGYSIGSLPNTFAPVNATNCTGYCVDQLCKIYNPGEDQVPLNESADQEIIMYFDFWNYTVSPRNVMTELFNPFDNEYNRFYVGPTGSHVDAAMNNISYGNPQGPLISQTDGYSYMCGDNVLSTCTTKPCTCAHVYNIPLGAIVDVMIYDKQPLSDLYHPFHLHGYSFCVLEAGQFNNAANKELISAQDVYQVMMAHRWKVQNNNYTCCAPKDTVVIPNTGYVILRFEANNPGWWFFHCHFSWHAAAGMNVIFHVGRPADLPSVPSEFPECYNWAPVNYYLQ